jgi:hypothetical protein
MRTICSNVLSMVIACTVALGQATTTSNIAGTLTDATGGAVPGAEVKATHTDTGLVRTVTSSVDGGYLITNLPIGPYQLQVSKGGFSTYVQSGIVLQVNSNPTVNVSLKVGAVSEQVKVEASAAVVETQSTAVGSVVDNQRVVDLPLNGRNPQELLLLSAPSVSMGSAIGVGRGYPAISISVAGSSVLSVLYELDGVDHSGLEAYQPLPIPFPDALQEFKLETSSMPARYGHHSGAVANIVTKTGTNDWHGDAFEYLRNGAMNARNFFAATRDTLKRNQFGGVIGGSVIKNKLFFFFGFQDTILRSDAGTTVATIPTAADRAGNFTVQESPACNAGVQKTLSVPFVNNVLPPSLISPITAKIGSWFAPTPAPDQCGTVRFGFPNASSEKQIIARADYQLSAKNQMFARFFTGRYNIKQDFTDATTNLLAATTGFQGAANDADTAVVGDTYLISPRTINTFRAAASYNANNNYEPTTAYPSALGINLNSLSPIPFVGFQISGSISIGTAGITNFRIPQSIGQVTDDIDMTRGNHQIAFGVNFAKMQYNYTSLRLDNGEFVFSGTRTGSGLADFVAGLPATLNQGYGARQYQRGNQIGFYIQDAWKATKRLNFNYGLRWEPFLPSQADQNFPFVEQFSIDNFRNNVTSSVYTNAPAGLIFPGDKGWNQGNGIAPKDYKIFSPRVGVTLDPRGQGKEVIRAGYGIFYDVPGFGFEINAANNPPFGGALSVANPSLANPYGNYPGGDPFPFKLGPTTTFPIDGAYNLFTPNSPNPYTQQWNLSVQKQFGSDWSLTLSYLGNKTTHQWIENENNPAIYIPGSNCTINGVVYSPCSTTANTEQRRVLELANNTYGKYYGFLQTTIAGGNAFYNAGVITLEKRFSRNVAANAIYTWSHCISVAEPGTINNHYDGQDPFNFSTSRGSCTQDVRQNFSSSYVFASPKFGNTWVQKLAGNWQLSPIIRIQSGLDGNLLSGKDYALNGTIGQTATNGIQRPTLTCAPSQLSSFTQSIHQWFNTSCYTPNGTGQLGNVGKNTIRGPRLIVVNVALSRKFPIREKQYLEFRAEAYNLPNLVNFALSTSSTLMTSTLFGTINSTAVTGPATTGQAGDPRILQIALKYVF